jgi:hypothetical membrane protein
MSRGPRRLRTLFVFLVVLALIGVFGVVSSVTRHLTSSAITYTCFTVICIIAAVQLRRRKSD